MTTKEIVKTIENLTGLYLEISINDNQTKVTSTYNPEKINFEYFNVCNELKSYFTELYLENNDLLLDRILKMLRSGFEFWNSIKVESFYINLNFDKKELEHLTTTLTAEQFLQIAEIKTHYIQSLISKIVELTTTTPKVKPQLGEYSNSQLVLIFYYFFKYSGIEPRVNTDIAPIAKFLHLITGKEFSNTQSSDFYKKLSKAPNHISDKSLIDDLNHIKPLFQKVELNEIVKMIDNEIDQCRTAIKETKTGKR